MTTAVIGATGRVGSGIVPRATRTRRSGRRARCTRQGPPRLRRTRRAPHPPTRLDNPRDLTEAFDGIRTVFARWDESGRGRRPADRYNAAAPTSSIDQVTRLSDPPADSLGITSEPTTSIASSPPRPRCRTRRSAPPSFGVVLAAAREVRASAPGPASPAAAAWP